MKKWTIIFLFTFPLFFFSQEMENNHWTFGNGMDLDFSTSPPTFNMSSIVTLSNVEPASISDGFGDLLAYSDGEQLYNSLGDPVNNGVFSNTANENIFCPIPNDENRYYLFRSGTGYVDYSIVDLSAFGGQGYIDPVEKETEFHSHQSQMMIASHANQMDHWLILVDNNSAFSSEISINSFLIDQNGIQLQSTFSNSYIWADWYSSIEEARVSPNCDRIATSYKGHNIVMFDFNNANGEITGAFPQSVALPDGFGESNLNYIEFSPSGDYLYVIQDHTMISRFNANLTDPTAFQNSGVEYQVNTMNNWSHIKRGRDGSLYLMDDNQHLDVLSDVDQMNITDVIFEDELVELPSPAEFFPNTLSLCVIPQAINTQDICQGSSSNFNATGYEFADSIYWDVDLPNTSDTLFYSYSENLNFTEPGTYDLVFYYLVDTVWYSEMDSITVFEQPTVDLGLDMTLCDGEELLLNAGSSSYEYFWSTNDSANEIVITSPGIYSVIVTNAMCTATDEVIIDFLFQPEVELLDSIFCESIIDLTLNAFDPNADQYSWNTGSEDPEVSLNTPGTYWVTASNDCFSATDSSQIDLVTFIDPIVDPLFSICGFDTLLVESNNLSGDITWSTGEQGPIASIIGEGVYSIEINDQGCLKSANFEVNREPFIALDNLIYPNIFTPNNDGHNELFRPFDPSIPELNPCNLSTYRNELYIYDRWGILVEGSNCFFDGSMNGIELVSGTYFYVSDMRSFCMDFDQKKSLQGSFELIRK